MSVNPKLAKQLMSKILEGGNVPFLLGGTGVGKSALVFEVAQDLANGREIVVDNVKPNKEEFGFIDFRLSLYESIDLGGLPYIDLKSNQQCRAFLGNLPVANEGLLFLDEFAQAHSSVQAVCGQLLYDRRLGEYKFPDGWHIVCAGNRASDRAGSTHLPSMVTQRCTMIDFEADFSDWLAWALENDVHGSVTGFLQWQSQYLRKFDSKDTKAQPSPRSWVRLSDTMKTAPSNNLIPKLAEGDVGEEASLEFTNFVNMIDEVPNLSDILTGKDVDTPEKAGVCFATVVALVNAITNEAKGNKAGSKDLYKFFDHALSYIQKFATPEYSIFFVRQVTSKNEMLKDTSTFSKFKIDNVDVEFGGGE